MGAISERAREREYHEDFGGHLCVCMGAGRDGTGRGGAVGRGREREREIYEAFRAFLEGFQFSPF